MSFPGAFASHCQHCGEPLTMMQAGLGHVCRPPDPRIVEKLEAIHRAVDVLWTRAGEIKELLASIEGTVESD